jgi:hypothetical protein
MLFYVYYDGYGHVQKVISAEELAKDYDGDPDQFLGAMQSATQRVARCQNSGHVGTLSFANEEELKAFLDSLGEEITGFYGCRSESRPYNF